MSLLFSPFNAGELELKNRVVLPPMATEYADAGGLVTEAHIEHYVARAGAGLVIIEHCYVHSSGKNSMLQLSAATDDTIEGLKQLASSLRDAGTKSVLQINHSGGAAKPEVTGEQPLGPSAVMHPFGVEAAVELSRGEIADVGQWYVNAAIRAEKAGFDAVELHGAHGYLLGQFLSPLTNKRQDQYGGDFERRLAFPLEVVTEVKRIVSIPVIYRLGACDGLEDGLSIDDGCRAAQQLVAAGISVVDVSGGIGGFRGFSGPGFLLPWARAIKGAVSVPVINAGGLEDPLIADKALVSGDIDLAAIGRAFLADARWPEKARLQLDGN